MPIYCGLVTVVNTIGWNLPSYVIWDLKIIEVSYLMLVLKKPIIHVGKIACLFMCICTNSSERLEKRGWKKSMPLPWCISSVLKLVEFTAPKKLVPQLMHTLIRNLALIHDQERALINKWQLCSWIDVRLGGGCVSYKSSTGHCTPEGFMHSFLQWYRQGEKMSHRFPLPWSFREWCAIYWK